MRPQSSKYQAGLTLIELLFTVAIVAILATFASRSVSAAVNASRSSSGVASLVATLTRASSSAANTGVKVVMCPSIDGENCIAGDHWEHGWIAFVATQGGSERRADDPIVFRQGALPPKVRLVSTAGRTRLHFQPNGGSVGSNVTFTFCDGRGPKKASAYAMGNAGHLHATAPTPANVENACAG